MRLSSSAVILLIYPFLVFAQSPGTTNKVSALSPRVQAVLNRIQPADLRGDLSFLSSDTLGGRFTPSPGLDVAAEFIASQFRAAGLDPVGDHEYFQTAEMVDRLAPKLASPLTLTSGRQEFTIPADAVEVFLSSAALQLDRVPAVIFQSKSFAALASPQ